MRRGDCLLAPIVRWAIRRPVPALLGDAFLLGFVWIVVITTLVTYVNGVVRSMVVEADRGMVSLEMLNVYAILAAIAEIAAKTCGLVAFGLLAIGLVKLHAEMSITRQE